MSVSPDGRKQFIDQQIGHMPSKLKLYRNIGVFCFFDMSTGTVLDPPPSRRLDPWFPPCNKFLAAPRLDTVTIVAVVTTTDYTVKVLPYQK